MPWPTIQYGSVWSRKSFQATEKREHKGKHEETLGSKKEWRTVFYTWCEWEIFQVLLSFSNSFSMLSPKFHSNMEIWGLSFVFSALQGKLFNKWKLIEKSHREHWSYLVILLHTVFIAFYFNFYSCVRFTAKLSSEYKVPNTSYSYTRTVPRY